MVISLSWRLSGRGPEFTKSWPSLGGSRNANLAVFLSQTWKKRCINWEKGNLTFNFFFQHCFIYCSLPHISTIVGIFWHCVLCGNPGRKRRRGQQGESGRICGEEQLLRSEQGKGRRKKEKSLQSKLPFWPLLPPPPPPPPPLISLSVFSGVVYTKLERGGEREWRDSVSFVPVSFSFLFLFFYFWA